MSRAGAIALNKWVIIGVLVVLLGGFLVWLLVASTKSLPGEEKLQSGRNHLLEGSKLDFKFNPPTSGDHFANWITKGFYEEPRDDGYLVHSMEHGYVIIWYNCGQKVTRLWRGHPGLDPGSILYRFRVKHGMTVNVAYAHEDATPSASSTSGGSTGIATAHFEDMPKSFSDGTCDSLKFSLKDLYQKDAHKLIVIPRVGMDSPVVLTAWGRMEKLGNVDLAKIKEFIGAFRDAGPEATVEP